MDRRGQLGLHPELDLSQAEQKYSPIEKEGLACVFGVKRFHT